MKAKWVAFAEEYLRSWNATDAAALAGYAHPRQAGSRLLSNVDIQKYIKARLAEKVLSADEVLVRLAEQARGEHGKYLKPNGGIDFNALIADGKAHLVKSIKETKYGLDIEFYDAQAALVHLGKHYGLFTEKLDLTSGGEKLKPLSDERFDRTISTLADALRENLSGAGGIQGSPLGPTVEAPMAGVSDESG